jgi:hypothetical protein
MPVLSFSPSSETKISVQLTRSAEKSNPSPYTSLSQLIFVSLPLCGPPILPLELAFLSRAGNILADETFSPLVLFLSPRMQETFQDRCWGSNMHLALLRSLKRISKPQRISHSVHHQDTSLCSFVTYSLTSFDLL